MNIDYKHSTFSLSSITFAGITVDNIIFPCSADKLRVYPALFELE